jgi:hypothetical protein
VLYFAELVAFAGELAVFLLRFSFARDGEVADERRVGERLLQFGDALGVGDRRLDLGRLRGLFLRTDGQRRVRRTE